MKKSKAIIMSKGDGGKILKQAMKDVDEMLVEARKVKVELKQMSEDVKKIEDNVVRD